MEYIIGYRFGAPVRRVSSFLASERRRMSCISVIHTTLSLSLSRLATRDSRLSALSCVGLGEKYSCCSSPSWRTADHRWHGREAGRALDAREVSRHQLDRAVHGHVSNVYEPTPTDGVAHHALHITSPQEPSHVGEVQADQGDSDPASVRCLLASVRLSLAGITNLRRAAILASSTSLSTGSTSTTGTLARIRQSKSCSSTF